MLLGEVLSLGKPQAEGVWGESLKGWESAPAAHSAAVACLCSRRRRRQPWMAPLPRGAPSLMEKLPGCARAFLFEVWEERSKRHLKVPALRTPPPHP